MKRLSVRILAAACAVTLCLVHIPLVICAQNSTDQLLEQIDSLRCAARYEEAIGISRELLDSVHSDADAAPYEIGDAERLVATLELASTFPENAQLELAAAERLTATYDSLFDEDDLESAIEVIDRQLEVKRRYLTEQHQEVAACLSIKALFTDYLGHYDAAESLYRKSLEIRRDILEPVHPETSEGLTNYAFIRKLQGYYKEAEGYNREALEMDRVLFGEEDPSVATDLDNLASSIHKQGDFVTAEPLYRRALAIRRMYYEDIPFDVASSLNNIGTLLHEKWDLAGAEPYFREALGVYDSLGVEIDPDRAGTTNNLASLLQDMGAYADAKRQYHRALDIAQELYGDIHPVIAAILNNLAALYHDIGDYTSADSLYRSALDMNRALYGSRHRQIATSQFNLARNCRDRGDYESAKPLYTESLEMYRSVLSAKNPDIVKILYSYTTLLAIEDDYGTALPMLQESTKLYEAARRRVGKGLVGATFVKSPYPKLAVALLKTDNEKKAWPAVERDLGRILAEFLIIADRRSLDPVETAVNDSLQRALSKCENRYEALAGVVSGEPSDSEKAQLEEARRHVLEAEAVWSEFQRRMAEKYPLTEGVSYSLERLQQVVPQGTAILGWLDVEEKKGTYTSWMYVIRNTGPVHWKHLGEGESGDGMSIYDYCRMFRDALTQPSLAVSGVEHNARRIFRIRIAPLIEALEGIENLIIIPSGPMLGIPIESLIDEVGNYLEDRFNISYTPSATLFTRQKEESKQRRPGEPTRALLIGDPPFSNAHLELMQEAGNTQIITDAAPDIESDSTATRRGIAHAHRTVLSSLPRLPGSRDEIQAIAPLFEETRVLLGQDASEMNVVDILTSNDTENFSVIHIATHAFIDNVRPEQSVLVLSQVNLPDPVRSAMAGERVYDGLISAKEIVQEWDISADLITLSACETALGKEVSGEGYIGLSHALFRAGAQSLIVSLWVADDHATALLMKRFYENYSGRYTDERHGFRGTPMSKAAALKEAKQWLRAYRDDMGETIYRHPFYWAPFVLIGNPD